MGLIEVRGIRVFAYHGCLREEESIGGHYRVDVAVYGEFGRAEASAKLVDTVDYGRVAAIVVREMGVRSKLIEHVAARILASLREQWPRSFTWKIIVVKEHPPIDGSVEEVTYTLEG